MTPDTFCKLFNSGNVKDKGQLFIQHDLKEADVNLLLPFPEGSPFTAVVFAGYLRVCSAVWYVIRRADEKRIPMGAFRMYADGEKTYKEWENQVPNKLWARAFKRTMIKTFEGCVVPEYMNN